MYASWINQHIGMYVSWINQSNTQSKTMQNQKEKRKNEIDKM